VALTLNLVVEIENVPEMPEGDELTNLTNISKILMPGFIECLSMDSSPDSSIPHSLVNPTQPMISTQTGSQADDNP
jgi:hypothetical protein